MNDVSNRQQLAKLIRDARAAKGYTQQELSDLAGISLRSVQRIENGEVEPRAYTLNILVERLGIPRPHPAPGPAASALAPGNAPTANGHLFTPTPSPQDNALVPQKASRKARRLILTIGSGLIIFLATAAFVAQSPRFPETDFERLLLSLGAISVYMVVLVRIWK
jgi:transcriptional regulator with XRE-family HTH domain